MWKMLNKYYILQRFHFIGYVTSGATVKSLIISEKSSRANSAWCHYKRWLGRFDAISRNHGEGEAS